MKKGQRAGSKRTASGNVSATARKKHGMRSNTSKPGSFPIFDRTSAQSALRLRGRAKSKKDRKSIINRARKFTPKKASEAYQRDKHAGKIE